MFTGFDFQTNQKFREHKIEAEKLFKQHKAQIKRQLDEFLLPDGKSLNGTEMQENWFPGVDANIFISHSHQNEDLAIGFAGYLNHHFGLECFIDSCVWGYANDLLKEIDNEYCKNKGEYTYDYNLRNYSTSHVHMMLANALTQMIDQTECIIFLKTPESISTADVIKNQTRSPWIYHEIAMTQLVRRKSRSEHRDKIIKKSLKMAKIFTEDKVLNIDYKLDLSHLHELNDGDLTRWEVGRQNNCFEYLDRLYKIKGLQFLTESYKQR